VDATATVNVAVPPGEMVCDAGDTLTEKSGVGTAVPVPESVAVCGEPEALSATDSVALKVVAEAGVNVT
jgi:hypothetical protein